MARPANSTPGGVQHEDSTPSPSSIRGGALGVLVFLAGAALAIVGSGLVLAPGSIPQGERIAAKLLANGSGPLALALHGAVVAALGLLARSLARGQARGVRELQSSRGQRTPQQILSMADDQSKIRAAMGNVQAELIAGKSRQDAMLEALKHVSTAVQNDQAQANALFRLAASLDQLGARIDQRLQAQQGEIRQQLDALTKVLGDTRGESAESNDTLLERLEMLAELLLEHSAQTPSFRDDLGYEPAEAEADELEVTVELEEGAGQELGLLDEFDEMGNLRAAPETPAPLPARIPFERADERNVPIDRRAD